MEDIKIRPRWGESSLDEGVAGMGWLWLIVLVIIALTYPRGHTTNESSLPLFLLLLLPAIFTLAIALGYFARLEIESDTLLFYGPQIERVELKASHITRVNVILVALPRGGSKPSLEIVRKPSQRTRIPMWFRRQDLGALLQQIKVRAPDVIFDERAELVERNKPLPD